MNPLISVIVPVFNRSNEISQCVSSVLASNLNSFELILIDDQSSDNSYEIIKSFDDPRVKVGQSPLRKNGNVARNTGAKLARGRYLTFLDSDDLFLPGRLNHLIQDLHEITVQDFIHLSAFKVKRGEKVSEITYPNGAFDSKYISRKLTMHAIPITCSTITIPKSFFESIGGYDENVSRHQDRDLLLDACERDATFYLQSTFGVMKIQSDSSFSRSSKNYFEPLCYLVVKHTKSFKDVPRSFIGYLISRGFVQSIMGSRFFNSSDRNSIRILLDCFNLSLLVCLLSYFQGKKLRRNEAVKFEIGG